MNATEIEKARALTSAFYDERDRQVILPWLREKELELEAKTIKGIQKTITVYNAAGETKEAKATVIEGLGAHKAWGPGYNVSHVATGLCVVHVKTLRHAKLAMRELLTLDVPWEHKNVTDQVKGDTKRILVHFISLTHHQGRVATMNQAREETQKEKEEVT